MLRRMSGFVLVLSIGLTCAPLSRSQNQVSGAIEGGVINIADRSPIPGAKILVTNEDTGTLRSTVSLSDGRYIVSNVQPGRYTLNCEHQDFESGSHGGIRTTRRAGRRSTA